MNADPLLVGDTGPPAPTALADGLELSIVMPCLNEARTLGNCIQLARRTLDADGIRGEIIVADNGSTDGSQEIARRAGARVVHASRRGYGAALAAGIAAARGEFVLMADSDESYDFGTIKPFVDCLRSGSELVMGNRFKGGIEPGAMPPLHRYFGNPLLTAIGGRFFRSPCGDFYCGQRAFRRDMIEELKLQSTGMEYALEMIIKSTMMGYRIAEVPVTLRPDNRGRAPHLRSWRDGWRSLRLFLTYSPRWLYLYPAMLLLSVGLLLGMRLMWGPVQVAGAKLDIHALLYCGAAIVIGFQTLAFSVFAKFHAILTGFHPRSSRIERVLSGARLEFGLLMGAALIAGGCALSGVAFWRWAANGFADADPSVMMRTVAPAVVALVLGFQVVFSSFYLALLQLQYQKLFGAAPWSGIRAKRSARAAQAGRRTILADDARHPSKL